MCDWQVLLTSARSASPLSLASERRDLRTVATTSSTRIAEAELHPSRLDLGRSSTSLIRRSRCWPLVWMSVKRLLQDRPAPRRRLVEAISVKPRMAFSGVPTRGSCWRNSDFAWLACSMRALRSGGLGRLPLSASRRASSRLVSFSRVARAPNSSGSPHSTAPRTGPRHVAQELCAARTEG